MSVLPDQTSVEPPAPPPAGRPLSHRLPAGRRQRLVLIGSIVFALLIALVLAGATVADARTEVPAGTTVLGIDIGGRDREAAAAALLAGVGDQLAAGVPITISGSPETLDPAAVGLNLDAAATADRAAEGGPNPFRLLFGGERIIEPVITVNEGELDQALSKRIGELVQGPVPASIVFDGLTPKAVYGSAGTGLDVTRAAEALQAGWLRDGVIGMPLMKREPTAPGEVDRMIAEFAKPAVAAPVTITTEHGQFVISPAAIAASLVLVDGPGLVKGISPVLDAEKLRAAIPGEFAKVEVKPQDATIQGGDGQPRVVASMGGRLVDIDRLTKELPPVLATPAPRTLAAYFVEVKANTSEADLAAQGIVERISTFTTYYPAGQDRGKNIHRVADEVDGAIVKPGEIFSLNKHTGDRNYAQGYLDAPTIQGGRLVNGVGGGVSQFTTTIFNGMYYAGLEDVFHQPHSYYFSRYPAVIESTIFYPSLDLKFRNDSPHSVLIDTSYTDTSITVTFWGTKRYDISTEWGPRRNGTSPQTIHLTGSGCIATDGLPGFTQDAWRIFKQDGREIKREKFTHRYQAEPKFVCD